MSKSQIPFKFLYDNTCLCCNQPIAGGKVYLLPDGRIMCDQCRVYTKQFCRNLIYEALASNFLYPCVNWRNHCSEILEWKDAPYHMSYCRYSSCCRLFLNHPAACFKGKLDFPNETKPPNLIRVSDKIENFLTCALCKAFLNCEPIYTHSDKESICHRCVAVNGAPPNAVRNVSFENIGTLFLFPCSFKRFGCTDVLPFGRAAWKHEYECRFNMNSPLNRIDEQEIDPTPRSSVQQSVSPPLVQAAEPIVTEPNIVVEEESRPSISKVEKVKKKGLIWTQTGPLWATLSPNTPMMAPPQRPGEESGQDALNQIRKKPGKHRQALQDFDADMGRRNSESESVSTNSQNTATADPIETASKTSSFDYIEDEEGNNMYEENSRHRNGASRMPNVQLSQYEAEITNHYPGLMNQYNQRAAEAEMASHFPHLARSSTNRYNEAVVAGHFPIMLPRQFNETVDTLGRRISKRENFQGNRLLISELKMRQDMIKRNHSIRDQPR